MYYSVTTVLLKASDRKSSIRLIVLQMSINVLNFVATILPFHSWQMILVEEVQMTLVNRIHKNQKLQLIYTGNVRKGPGVVS